MKVDKKSGNIDILLNLIVWTEMETRKCKKCGQTLPLERFETHRHTCRECRSKYKSDQRRQKPKQYNKYAIDRQNRCEAWINSLKTPCAFCGETDPVCIDWHHVDPTQKEFQISFIKGKAKERTLAEMAKCICITLWHKTFCH